MSKKSSTSPRKKSMRLSVPAVSSIQELENSESLQSLALSPRVISIPKKNEKGSTSDKSRASPSAHLALSPGRMTPATSASQLLGNPSMVSECLAEPGEKKQEFVLSVMEDILSVSGLPYYEIMDIKEDLNRRIERAKNADPWKRKGAQPARDYRHTCLNMEQLMAVSRIRDESLLLLDYSRDRDAAVAIQRRVRGWLVRRRLSGVTRENREPLLCYARAVYGVMKKEKAYLRALQKLVDGYMKPMKSADVLSKKERQLIFGNIKEIRQVQKAAYKKLERKLEPWPFVEGVGKALLKVAPSLSAYGFYVSNFGNSSNALMRLKKEKPDFFSFVSQVDREKGISLSSILGQPVNHIAKFSSELKILEPLATSVEERSELQAAIQLFEDAGMRIKEALIGGDATESIEAVQRRIAGSEDLDLVKPDRVLREQGEVMVDVSKYGGEHCARVLGESDTKAKLMSRTIFLFNDILLVTALQDKNKKLLRKRKNTVGPPMLNVVDTVPLKTMQLDEDRGECQFGVSSDTNSFTFIAKSPENKAMWVNNIKGLIEMRDASRVFGVPLMELLEREDRVHSSIPILVEMCMDYIKSTGDGVRTEGIFRISGMKKDLDELQEMFDTREKDVEMEGKDIHAVAGTLLSWLRELPEPLLGFDMFDPLLNSLNPSPVVASTKDLLKDIKCRSPCHMTLFKALVFFWGEVTEHRDVNKMGPDNIAIVVGPNVLRPRVDTIETALRSPLVNQVIETIVTGREELFADFDSW